MSENLTADETQRARAALAEVLEQVEARGVERAYIHGVMHALDATATAEQPKSIRS